MRILVALLGASAAFAQQWEFGGTIGLGAYRSGSATAPGGTATAGIRNGFTAGAIIGEDMYQHVSGEFRYLYQGGDPFVGSGSIQGSISGQSHSFHYNVLIHFRDTTWCVRPYISVGAGAKYFDTVGPAPLPQPLPRIVNLAPASQWRALATVGGGVKYRMSKHALLRGEFLDYITPMPKKLFIPASSGGVRGILNQFTPMFGVSYVF